MALNLILSKMFFLPISLSPSSLSFLSIIINDDGCLLVSQYSRLLSNPCCKRLLINIYASSELTEPIYGLYCNYVDRAWVVISGR